MSGDFTAFFYGTLMAPEVFFTVCYGMSKPPQAFQDMHSFTSATLNGYCRHRVRFADYPAIIPEEGCSVRGVYATGLTDANMQKLDYFEGSEYKKVNVKVKLLRDEGGKEVEAEEKDAVVYVFLSAEDLEKGEWDFEHFRKEKLAMWAR